MTSQTVYVSTRSNGGNPRIIHTERDCPCLKKARNTRSFSRSSFPDETPVCERCTDGAPVSHDGRAGPWQQLEAMNPGDLVTDGGSE